MRKRFLGLAVAVLALGFSASAALPASPRSLSVIPLRASSSAATAGVSPAGDLVDQDGNSDGQSGNGQIGSNGGQNGKGQGGNNDGQNGKGQGGNSDGQNGNGQGGNKR